MIDTISLQDLNFSYYILHKKPLWNVVVILYIGVSYCGSFVILLSSNICLNTMGCVLLSHSLTLSAYLSHEFMHGTIFEKNKWNIIGGNIMLWLNGGVTADLKAWSKNIFFTILIK
jgi:hypothetical protein